MKKKFKAPKVKIIALDSENLMITASPGVGSDYTPGMSIDSKRNGVKFDNYTLY